MEGITVELNRKNVERLVSDAGGFTRVVIEGLGITWPAKAGWRADLEKSGRRMSLDEFKRLESLRNPKKKEKNKKPKIDFTTSAKIDRQIELITALIETHEKSGSPGVADELREIETTLRKIKGLPKFLGL